MRHFLEHLNRFSEVHLEVPAHHVEYFEQQGIPDGIEHLIAILAVEHNLTAAKDRQVLGEIRLLQSKLLLNGPGR